MADWEEWCEIIARCMGYEPLAFVKAYAENEKLQHDLVLEDRPVARAIIRLVESLPEDKEWAGYNTTLLNELNEIAATQLDLNMKTEKLWPKSASALSRRIGEVKPTLRKLDIEIYETKDSKTRIKTIHIRRRREGSKMPPVSPVPPDRQGSRSDQAEMSNGILDSAQTPPDMPPDKTTTDPENRAQDRDSNDTNDTNGIIHTSLSIGNLDYFDVDGVQIVNVHTVTGFPKCDINIGRKWKAGYGDTPPLLGVDGELGNPFVMDENGGHDGTRGEVMAKYEVWLWHGNEPVNGYDPKAYRRNALKLLPGCYKWGCHCKPEACHGDILKKWLRRQLQIQKARSKYEQENRVNKSSTK